MEQGKGHFLLTLKEIKWGLGTNVDKPKSNYGGTEIKEEMGGLGNSHLVAPIFVHWQSAEGGGQCLSRLWLRLEITCWREKEEEKETWLRVGKRLFLIVVSRQLYTKVETTRQNPTKSNESENGFLCEKSK